MFTKNTKEILEGLREPVWHYPDLNLKGKITQKHSQEIEEIIQEKLRFQYDKGYDAGVKHYQQHIDEALRLYKQEYSNTPIHKRQGVWEALNYIKKINETQHTN